jgi:hypothetical protein
VVVALAVELTCAGEFMPGLEMFGYGLVEQSALGVARVVELGFGTRLSARVRMRLRWVCACVGCALALGVRLRWVCACVGCAVVGMGQCQQGLGA